MAQGYDGAIRIGTKVDNSGIIRGMDTAKTVVKTATGDMRSQVARLASEYRKQGFTASDAYKRAWAEIKAGSQSAADGVISQSHRIEDAARDAQNTIVAASGHAKTRVGTDATSAAQQVKAAAASTASAVGIQGEAAKKSLLGTFNSAEVNGRTTAEGIKDSWSSTMHQMNAGTSAAVDSMSSKLARLKDAIKRAAIALGVVFSVSQAVQFAKGATAEYNAQAESEAKLARVMRNTMQARNDEIRSVLALADAQEKLGVVSGDVQTAGAQELATYLMQVKTLQILIPVMNDMAAQQLGVGASAESVTQIATMLGKVMNGQVAALSRYGYEFDKAQEKILKFGSEEQRAAVLAEVVGQSVGGMNFALAQTDAGRQWQLAEAFGAVRAEMGAAFSQIGVLFIPALRVVANALAVVANLARQAAQYIALLFGKQITGAQEAAAGFGSVAGGAGAAADAQDRLAEATEGAGKAAKGALAAFDDLNVLQDSKGGGGGSSGGAGDFGGTGGVGGGEVGIAEDVEISPAFLAAMQKIRELLEPLQQIDLSNLKRAFDELRSAVEPITRALFAGLEWAWYNLLVPLASWTIESAVPAFLRALAGTANVLSAMITALQPLAIWLWENFLKPIAEWTGGVIVSVLEGLAQALSGVSDWINENQELVQGIAQRVLALAAAFLLVNGAITLWNFVTGVATSAANLFSGVMAFLTSPIGLVTLAIGLLIAAIWWLVENWETVKETAIWVWEQIVNTWNLACNWFMENVINPLRTFFADGLTFIMNLFSALWGAIVSIWEVVSGWFTENVITPLREAFDAACIAVSGFFQTAWDTISELWDTVKGWFDEHVITPVREAFGSFCIAVCNFFTESWVKISGIWATVRGWFDKNVINPVRNAFNTALNNVKTFFSNAWSGIKGVWEKVAGWFDENVVQPIQTLFENVSTAIKDVINGIIGTANWMIEKVESGVNGIIGMINSIGFDIPAITVFGHTIFEGTSVKPHVDTVSFPRIPLLATGAVIPPNAQFAAILGDQRYGRNLEAPESLIRQIVREESGGGEIVIRFEGSMAQFVRELRPVIERENRRVGKALVQGGDL